jgi:NAD(P)-dependent dehydrogenase (short-subunit alcohol dehydrogenase family)
MAELSFKNRVIIVTGAGRGIGRAHAELLSGRGASVVVCDVGCDPVGEGASAAPADEVVDAITAKGGAAVATRESVATPDGAKAIVNLAIKEFGRLDGVINNAGIFDSEPFMETPDEKYRQFMDVHFMGSMFMARAAWPYLIASGSGRIVNTVSGAMLGVPLMVHYGSAKGAIFGLTRTLAVTGAEYGIKVNAIAPGAGTRLTMASAAALPPGLAEKIMESNPPALVAPAAAYLVHESCALNGETLNVGGGRVSRLVMMTTPGIEERALTPEAVRDRIGEITDVSAASPFELMLPPQTTQA